MTKKLFTIYSPETECVEVSLNANTTVHLDKPSNIAYLPRLAREEYELLSCFPEMAACKSMLRQ